MNKAVKQIINLALSTVILLASFGLSAAGICSVWQPAVASVIDSDNANDSMDVMPCCIIHKTPGLSEPCHCQADDGPVALRQNFAISTHDHEVKQAIVQPWLSSRQLEVISEKTRLLASDIRLRAPPRPLYLLKCSLLE